MFQKSGSGSYNNLLMATGGLESIESDKEGEDLQMTLRKKPTYKREGLKLDKGLFDDIENDYD